MYMFISYKIGYIIESLVSDHIRVQVATHSKCTPNNEKYQKVITLILSSRRKPLGEIMRVGERSRRIYIYLFH